MKVLLLVLISISAYSQSVFKADLYVRSIHLDTATCYKMPVVWGVKDEEICFYVDKVRCYISISKSSVDEYLGLQVKVKDEFDQNYMVSYLRGEDGFIIWITNLERSFPSFVLSTTDICRK